MFLALRDLRRSSRRFLLVGLVVLLVTVLSTVLSGLADGLVQSGTSGLQTLPVTDLAFEPGSQATFSRSTLGPAALVPWHRLARVEASPIGVSFVNAVPSSGGAGLSVVVFGVEPTSEVARETGAGAPLARSPGLVVSASLAGKLAVGHHYQLGSSGVSLPVLGSTTGGSYGHVPVVFTTLAAWQAMTYGDAAHGRFSAIALRLPPHIDAAALRAAASAAGTEVMSKSQAYAGSPGYSAETGTMTLIRGFLLVISALVVGAFFTVLTVQRTRQIGLLKAMGASNAYVLRDGLGQMAVIVVAAVAAGAIVGGAIIALLGGGSAPIVFSLRSVVGSAVLLAVAGIVGSLVPLRRITGIEPAIVLGVEA